MSATDRVSALRDQLASNVYELNAGEFIRFRPEANDDAVAGVVRSVVTEGEEGCDAFRHGLDTGEADTLRLFAMRRTLLARRLSSLGPIYEALDAFALLPINDVPWDSWVKGSLYVSRSIGGDLVSMERRFVDLNPDAAHRCHDHLRHWFRGVVGVPGETDVRALGGTSASRQCTELSAHHELGSTLCQPRRRARLVGKGHDRSYRSRSVV